MRRRAAGRRGPPRAGSRRRPGALAAWWGVPREGVARQYQTPERPSQLKTEHGARFFPETHDWSTGDRAWKNRPVDERDFALRNVTYTLFVELGRAPTGDEVGRAAGLTLADVHAGWRRLHDAHALVLNGSMDEIWMANPFSAVPTAHRVEAGDRWWYANCAWDAFGICAALHVDGRIETSCPDCVERIDLEVRDERPDDESLLFHCLVAAARWWDDVVFT